MDNNQLLWYILTMKEMTPAELAHRSIMTKYRADLWSPFLKGISTYQMLKEGDSVAVCISGGKDSMLLAVLMTALHRFSDFPFDLHFIAMNPGYNDANLAKIIENAKTLNIPLKIFNSDIFNVVDRQEKSPCYLCARMRRGFLYKKAKELGCNKIALGHHFNDVIETTLLGMFYGAQIQTMMPKVHSENFEGMELIRPLYLVRENDIIAWSKYNNLSFIQCACRVTEKQDIEQGSGKRQEIKLLLKTLKETNPEIEQRIFKSLHCVNLNTMIGYKLDGIEHSFLELYDSWGERNKGKDGRKPQFIPFSDDPKDI